LGAEPLPPPPRNTPRPRAQAARAHGLGGSPQGLPDVSPRAAVGGLQLRPPATRARPAGQATDRKHPGSAPVRDRASDAPELGRVAGDPPLRRLLSRPFAWLRSVAGLLSWPLKLDEFGARNRAGAQGANPDPLPVILRASRWAYGRRKSRVRF